MSTQNLEPILFYDINTVPYGLTGEQVMEIYKNHKIVLYDLHSYPKYCEPRIFTIDKEVEYKMIDTKALKPAEVKELVKGLEEIYKAGEIKTRIPSVYDKEYCNHNDRIVSKYVYYVREILHISKDIPMNGSWLKQYETDEKLYDFPLLTMEQIVQLDLESKK